MVSLFLQWKSQFFGFSVGWADGGNPRVHIGKFVLTRTFALRCLSGLYSHTHTHTKFAPPSRANPAQTKGSVTFLNAEINLSWHRCFGFFSAAAFMVISFRKGGETICDSIRRGFYALIWFTNLSHSLPFRILFPFFTSDWMAAAATVGYCVQNNVLLVLLFCVEANKTRNWISCETSESQHILRLLKNCCFLCLFLRHIYHLTRNYIKQLCMKIFKITSEF